jgi:molybdopterin-guanine dinucleotide biosynthesis protein A
MSLIAGVVLAGGKSSRMGEDKAKSLLVDKSLLATSAARLAPQVSLLAINANRAHPLPGGSVLIGDSIGGQPGPLAGILAGLEWAADLHPRPDHVAFVPVDAPFFPDNLVARLAAAADGNKIIVARASGHVHPVFSLWPVNETGLLRLNLLSGGPRKVIAYIETQPHAFVDFDSDEPFFNINTPDDLAAAAARMEHA